MARQLEAWTPLHELERFHRNLDEMFGRLGGGRFLAREFSEPAIESFMEGGKLIVRADLPGIDPKDVEINVVGDTLVLRGKREHTREEKGRRFIHREVDYGAFERVISLPAGVKSEDIKAAYEKGVLELTIAMPKEAVPRKIPIQVDGSYEPKAE